MFPPTLETPRLLLRPVTDADIDAIFAACSSPTLTAYTLFDTHPDRATSAVFVQQYARPNYAQGIPDPLAICWKDDPDTLIGCTGGRHGGSACNKCLEVGYWVAEPHWGKGVAVEAVRALVPYLFADHSAERVQAHCMAPNVSSARVLEKAGFAFEGTLRRAVFRRGQFHDIRLYSVVRGDAAAG
jgi:ribosomal-protein-alanine N-acetyltransferase